MKGAKHVPIKGVDDKQQITATFAVSASGKFFAYATNLCWKDKKMFAKVYISTQFPRHLHEKPLVKSSESHRAF